MWKERLLPRVLKDSIDCGGIRNRAPLIAEKERKCMKPKLYIDRYVAPRTIRRRSALTALLLVYVVALAQASLLDTSFNPGSGANNPITAVARQADGRIVIAGTFTEFNGIPRNRIARLNPDGSVDAAFNPGAGADDDINAVAIQPDGRIVIGGFFSQFNGVSRSGIARLQTDGSLDTTFDPGTGVETLIVHPQVHAVGLHADGRIVIGGFFKNVNGVPRDGIAQLDAGGSVDLTFNPGTGLQS